MPISLRWVDIVARDFVKDFDAGFIQQVFQMIVINYEWTSPTLFIFKIHTSTTEILNPAPDGPITSGSFTPFLVDTGSCLKGFIPKLELMQKMWMHYIFFVFMIWDIWSLKSNSERRERKKKQRG